MRNEHGGRDERVTTNIDAAVLTDLEYALQVAPALVGTRKWTCYDEELFFRGNYLGGELWFSLLVVARCSHMLRRWDDD
jgi:hypothetical protein